VISPAPPWPLPAVLPPPLAADEVHVWCAGPESCASADRFRCVLTADEHERVQRFVSPAARQQFVLARGLLRTLLGHYLDRPPQEIAFTHGPAGKPMLAEGPRLHFNISHSHGFVLAAFSGVGEVGVDVEKVRLFSDEMELAHRFFAPAEAAALAALEGEQRRHAFFHVWTRKEAFLKATGQGIAFGLERFEVSVPPDDPARICRIDGSPEPAQQWSLRTLTPAAEYVGTLALETNVYQLRCWRWPEE
jgi:4'-phosphopantetheinyl transferase